MLWLLFYARGETAEFPDVHIDCPGCNGRGVAAQVSEQRHRFYSVLIPLFRLRNTYVACRDCRKRFLVMAKGEELAGMDAAALQAAILPATSLLARRWLVFAALVLCWVPLVGAILGVVAFRKNRNATPGLKGASFLAMVLGVGFTLMWIVLYVWTAISNEMSIREEAPEAWRSVSTVLSTSA